MGSLPVQANFQAATSSSERLARRGIPRMLDVLGACPDELRADTLRGPPELSRIRS
jgi:hypothetical protein